MEARAIKTFVFGICLLVVFNLRGWSATHFVNSGNSTPLSPYTEWSTAATNIQDAVNVASAGETVLVTNGTFNTSVQLASDGTQNRLVVTNPIVVMSVNGSTNTIIDGGSSVRCVYLTNGARLDGFTLTHGIAGKGGGAFCASTNETISNCQLLNNSANGGQSGGVYYGTLTNCLISGNNLNGPTVINIGGGGASESLLINCSLTGNKCAKNVVGLDGGGARYCTLINCAINNNSADRTYGSGGGVADSTAYHCAFSGNSGERGGAAMRSTLSNCTISGNTAYAEGAGTCACVIYNSFLSGNNNANGASCADMLYNCVLVGNNGGRGGGAYNGWLYNCTVTGNSAVYGGGVDSCTVVNSIVYNNTTSYLGPNYYATQYDRPMTLNNCCTTPLPPDGTGNFTSAPGFVSASDLRLQSNSPCIDAGNNSYNTNSIDFNGRPRVVGASVDIGAYEFQGAAMDSYISWLLQVGLPADNSTDSLDADGDGMSNWQEWIAGTDPTNSASVLSLLLPSELGQNGINVSWQSVANRNYFLQRGADLGNFTTIQSNIVGQFGTTTYLDAYGGAGTFFYRVGVQQ
jgi:hypothetical protein